MKFKLVIFIVNCFFITKSLAESVIAIDIALVPDAQTTLFAERINAQIRQSFPRGVVLDANHHAHITLVQCFVPVANLAKVYAVAKKIVHETYPAGLTLEAYQYGIYPWASSGVAVIKIKPDMKLAHLQKALLAGVAPYTATSASAAAFYGAADIDRPTIDYVIHFATRASGKFYNPHITVGLAELPFLKKLSAHPFREFTFVPSEVAVFQLGNSGTATIKLKTLRNNSS